MRELQRSSNDLSLRGHKTKDTQQVQLTSVFVLSVPAHFCSLSVSIRKAAASTKLEQDPTHAYVRT